MGRSKKAQKGGDAGPSDAGSHSGSDDVVLVSKDLEDSAAKGATRRTRSKKG
jgi:hypothetical protein